MFRFIITLLVFGVVCSAPNNVLSAQWRYDDVARVVAISDVHGDVHAMSETLQSAKLLDEGLAWSGGRAHLVVVGDILDRGADSRKAMELLMRIEGEAAASGGQVHVLIGNHESMLLTGDLRYVSAAEYAAFAGDEDIEERTMWRDIFVARGDGSKEELLATFEAKYPIGYFAMRRAFRADGRYGAWLLEKNIVEVINGTAFVHGGLSPEVADIGLQTINRDLRRELRAYVEALAVLADAHVVLPTDSHYDYESLLENYQPPLDASPELLQAIETATAAQSAFLLSREGPLWYRSNVRCQEIVEEHRLQQVLTAIDAHRLVVGHTPSRRRQVQQRFGGQLIEIDTGMLSTHYGGSGNALVIDEERLSVVNQTGTVSDSIAAHPRRVGGRPGNLSAEQLESLLRRGEIQSVENQLATRGSGLNRTLVTVDNGEHEVTAIFLKQRKKGVLPNVAAYRLDRLLRLDMVPVTVARSVKGKPGSLQFLPDRRANEQKRVEEKEGRGASCDLVEQWAAMYVFDALIYNQGRTQQRMLYDPSHWQLMLSEHDRAFAAKKGRPAHLKSARLSRNSGWQRALIALDDDVLSEHFSDVLDKRRRKALAARRDQLLREISAPK